MKKMIFITMAFVAMLTFTACGGGSDDEPETPEQPTPVTPVDPGQQATENTDVNITNDTTTDQPACSRKQ